MTDRETPAGTTDPEPPGEEHDGDASSEEGGRRFSRPWEEPLEPEGGVDGDPSDEPTESTPGTEGAKAGQLAGAEGIESDSAISEEAYLSATTHEYRDLAEEIARGGAEDAPRSAAAASMAGVGSGLVDFADVTGRAGVSDEDAEREEQAAASDLTLRIISAVVLIGLFLATLFVGGWLFTLFVGLLMVISVGELYATLRRHNYVPLSLFGILGVFGSAVAAHLGGPGPVLIVMLATALTVVLFFSVVPRRRPLENLAVTVLGAMWVSLLALATTVGQAPEGAALILLLVLLVALFDIGSYFAGRAIGRLPFAPTLSPKKTWEGFIGGIVTVVALSALLSTFDYFPIDLTQGLVLSAMVVVLAPLGDAAESMIKRSLGVKDMGSVLPGHGGMLDRIDAFLFVVPAAYLYFRTLGLL
ncbi:MAG TPA: phosphatidate cytidylyltransferase [Acidimicrobiia bacterium]|jgi:phosphatidate cytidylyltransferase